MPLFEEQKPLFDGHRGPSKTTDVSKARRVFVFRKGHSAGDKSMKELLGGKGANLCEMARIGLNVPPGLTITTETCQEFQALGGKLPEGLWEEVVVGLKEVEEAYGAKFADPANPLLVSVRSGAAVSMPGMMDTVLNLGLNDRVVTGLAAKRGERFAYDSYRRLLDMFADVVLGVPHEHFEKEIGELKAQRGVKLDVELSAADLKELCERYKKVYKANNIQLPEDPNEQLRLAICAVFRSWNIPRAVKYRTINRITGLKGTAVNVQSMVYGNLNDDSCTGVCFTRNAGNGTKELYGEFLINAQGEDVVAGIRTPLPIVEMGKAFPEAYADLLANTQLLENHMKDMQDCEFTVQDKQLYMLQTRNGKRTGQAALKVALDMVAEGLVTEQQAINMVEPRHLEQLLHPEFENPAAMAKSVVASGLPASPGAAVGRVVFTADDAEQWQEQGEKVILVRLETSPEDVGGMHAAEGILTARGGMTSHAAVVARGWGKPCVCGCEALEVLEEKKCAKVGNVVLCEGDWISLNGTTGEVFKGKQPLKRPSLTGNLATFMKWVDATRTLQVLANADTPEDAKVAVENGAQGLGLCRTEHMFFSSAQRIATVRRMIAAEQLNVPKMKVAALSELKAFQRADFEGIFAAMDGMPVTIRLLDPPLHEFLPKAGPALDALCESLAAEYVETPDLVTPHMLKNKIESLHEANPMMGFRGCRLGIVHPDITHMQVSAILEAAVAVSQKGVKVHPHIMIPLVGIDFELEKQIEVAHAAAKEVFTSMGKSVAYEVGTMIEVPRGALMAGRLAKMASFFSFGSNDLTQMTFGFSRDDAEAKIIPTYLKEGILPSDPFQELDTEGVGELIQLAVCRGRAANPQLGLGICGEHGGDPKSILFFHKIGLDYVSCSPLRVPVARLAAAQAALKQPKQQPRCHADGWAQ